MRRFLKITKRGDTLIEVMLSISIFALVAMITINMMNDGINTAQRTLEAEMARNEIDAQAEALRFIHNNYVAERQKLESDSQFRTIWRKLTSNAIRPSMTTEELADKDGGRSFDINDMNSCEDPYAKQAHLERYKAFVLNTRLILPELSTNNNFRYLGKPYSTLSDEMIVYYTSTGTNKLVAPSLYPRIIYSRLKSAAGGGAANNSDANLDEGKDIYNNISSAEGIWVNAVSNLETATKTGADYYDFYIRTCWHAAGQRVPSTITTVIRLYNPEVME